MVLLIEHRLTSVNCSECHRLLIVEAIEEIKALRKLNEGLAERCAGQSEVLTRMAGRTCASAESDSIPE